MKRLALLLLFCSPAWPQERRLVWLRQQTFGHYAECDPSFDFTCYLPRRYRVSGLEEQWLRNVSNLPSRLWGKFSGDQVKVPKSLDPSLLPLPLGAQKPWRGVAAVRPGQIALQPEVWQSAQVGSAEAGLYRLTAWKEGGHLKVTDLQRIAPIPTPTRLSGPIQAIVSDGFLDRTLELYRQAHPQQFQWSPPGGGTEGGRFPWSPPGGGTEGGFSLKLPPGMEGVGFELSHLGMTTLGQEFRAYASVSGLGSWLAGEWEAPVEVTLSQGYAQLQLRAQGQAMRLVRPIFAEVPPSWLEGATSLMQRFFSTQAAMPIPGAYLQPLLQTGLVTQEEMAQLKVRPLNWGDRRSGSTVLDSGEFSGGPPLELGWLPAQGFALAFSEAAINRSLQQWLPTQLPQLIDVPAQGVPSPQVLIFKLRLKKLEIQQLALRYEAGAFRFDPCQIAVHWELGPLSGVEPGARLTGRAIPEERGFRLAIENIEFLSPQILKQSPSEQERLRQQIRQTVAQNPFPVPWPESLLTPVHPEVGLTFTGFRAMPDRLWLLGSWKRPSKVGTTAAQNQ
jgi:hypothetical protein